MMQVQLVLLDCGLVIALALDSWHSGEEQRGFTISVTGKDLSGQAGEDLSAMLKARGFVNAAVQLAEVVTGCATKHQLWQMWLHRQATFLCVGFPDKV